MKRKKSSEGGVPSPYELLSREEIPWLGNVGTLVSHGENGALVYHIASEDPENFFAYSFLTPPVDNKGTPHILEHAVLCGSEKFPVRDPFLSMIRRGGSTFLNALTYADKTVYPAASVIEKEFFNLLKIYGDAVFFPLLKLEAFQQEGHHLRFSDGGALQRNGIVLNEMKGNATSLESLTVQWLLEALFPNTPYGFSAGGVPEEIPLLTYDDFLMTHKRWYRPDNCRIVFYGNIPMEKSLAFLEEKIFSRWKGAKKKTETIPYQERFLEPKRLERSFPAFKQEASNRDTTLALGWLTTPCRSQRERVALRLLEEVLVGHAGAPLWQALQQAPFGEDPSPISGFLDYNMRERAFSVVLRHASAGDAEAFERLVFKTLSSLATEGISKDLIEGAFNEMEFREREILTGRSFGMKLVKKVLSGWHYGVDPAESLALGTCLKDLREGIPTEFFEELIKKEFLENPHRILLSIQSDPKTLENQRCKLAREMKTLQETLSEADREQIQRDQKNLHLFREGQDTSSSLSTLTPLTTADVPRIVEKIPSLQLEEERVSFPQIYTCGIAYIDMAFPLADLDSELFPWLALFAEAWGSLGLPGVPYEEIEKDQARLLGGISLFLKVENRKWDALEGGDQERDPVGYLVMRVKLLESYWDEASQLIEKILSYTDFQDIRRLKTLWLEAFNDLEATIPLDGSRHALCRAGSHFSKAISWQESWHGPSQLQTLASIEKRGVEELSGLLRRIHHTLWRQGNPHVSITGSQSITQRIHHWWQRVRGDQALLQRAGSLSAFSFGFSHPMKMEGVVIEGKVAYTGAVLRTPSFNEPGHPHAELIAHLLSSGYLFEQIRMKGGGYGGGVFVANQEALLQFYSHRDPEIAKTLEIFGDSLGYLADSLTEQDVRVAVIACGSRELQPTSPSQRAILCFLRHLYGITDEVRQERREHLLSATRKDLRDLLAFLSESWKQRSVTVLANQHLLDQAARFHRDLSKYRTLLSTR